MLTVQNATSRTDVYPLPATMTKLVLPDETDFNTTAHPSFLSGVSTEGLIKMFEFGLWSERMVRKGKFATLSDVIKAEISIYETDGFGLRDNFQAPVFPKVVLNSSHADHMKSIKSSLTDMGLCTTVNAKSVGATYDVVKNKRVREFAEILDEDEVNDVPIQVTGSGFLHQTTYWLNVQGLNKQGFSRGSMTMAINNRDNYFSVRYKDVKDFEYKTFL